SWIAALPTPGGPLPSDLIDTDGDGIPDGWEIAHGLDPNANDAGQDLDHDGFSNFEEFEAGTNPLDSEARLRLWIISMTPTSDGLAVVLGFFSNSNKTYSVAYRDYVGTAGWTSLVNIKALPIERFTTVTNTVAANVSSRFYRLVTPRLP